MAVIMAICETANLHSTVWIWWLDCWVFVLNQSWNSNVISTRWHYSPQMSHDSRCHLLSTLIWSDLSCCKHLYYMYVYIVSISGNPWKFNPDSICAMVLTTATQTDMESHWVALSRHCGFAMTSWGQISEHLPSCIHGCLIVLGIPPHRASWPVQSPHILCLLPWPPRCVCFVVSRKKLSCGFSPCALMLGVAGMDVSLLLWSRCGNPSARMNSDTAI